MIGTVNEKHEHNTGNDLPPLRQTAMFVLVDNMDCRRRLFAPAGDLRLEAFDARTGIHSEKLGVGAHEPNRVGSPRKLFYAVFLQGFEMILANLQRTRNCGKIVAAPQPRCAQVLANRFQWRIHVAGNFAQMDTALVLATAFLNCKMRNLRHISAV